MRYTEKLSEHQQLKISPSLAKAVVDMANQLGIEKNDWLRTAIASAVIDQGGYLPPECPENPAYEWPEGSANYQVDKLIREALPGLRELVGDFAFENAEPRFEKVMAEVRELRYMPLTNYALEKFCDRSLTPLQRLHYVEERLKGVKAKLKSEQNVQ